MTEAGKVVVANSELLFKQSTRFGQSYKQHFFRFLKPPSNGGCYTLQYNANRSKVQEIKLENVLSVDERKAKSQANAFVIHCTDRKFQFACSSSNDLERWLETLRRELITKPVTAKPGKDTYEIEIDPTELSCRLQLNGLYLFEVTDAFLILWLPRSRKETIRWQLCNIHHITHLKPAGATSESISIDFNEMCATGAGTLILKTNASQGIIPLIEKYTGKKVHDARESLKIRQSMRKRTASHENLRRILPPEPLQLRSTLPVHAFSNGTPTHLHIPPTVRRNISEGSGMDSTDSPALPKRHSPNILGPRESLTPIATDSLFSSTPSGGGSPSSRAFIYPPLRGHGQSFSGESHHDVHVHITEPMEASGRAIPAQTPGSILSGVYPNQSPSDNQPGGSAGSPSVPDSPRPSLLPHSPLASPSSSLSASPLFPRRPPSLPPRPPSPSPARRSSSPGISSPPAIPPRPGESFEQKSGTLPVLSTRSDLPPPVSPRGMNTFPRGAPLS